MSIQTPRLNPKPPESICPSCGRRNAGITFTGTTWRDIAKEKRGPYCKYCLFDFLFVNVPKTQKVEEKGKENAG